MLDRPHRDEPASNHREMKQVDPEESRAGPGRAGGRGGMVDLKWGTGSCCGVSRAKPRPALGL